MSVIDKLTSISDTLSEVFKFAAENTEIKQDFEEYLKTIGLYNAQQSQINAVMVTYVFERMFHKGEDTVFSLFLKEKTDIKEIYGVCLEDNVASKRVLEKSGFDIFYIGEGLYQGENRRIVKSKYVLSISK